MWSYFYVEFRNKIKTTKQQQKAQLHGLKEQTSVSRDRGAGVGAGTAKSSAAKSLPPRPAPRDPTHGSPPGSPPLGFSRQEHWSGLPFPSPMQESEKWKGSRSVVSDSSNFTQKGKFCFFFFFFLDLCWISNSVFYGDSLKEAPEFLVILLSNLKKNQTDKAS